MRDNVFFAWRNIKATNVRNFCYIHSLVITILIFCRLFHPMHWEATWCTVQPHPAVQQQRAGCLPVSSFPLPIPRTLSAHLPPLWVLSHLLNLRWRSLGWSSASHPSPSGTSSSARTLRRGKSLCLNYQQSAQPPIIYPAGRWQSLSSTHTIQTLRTTTSNTLRKLLVGVFQLPLSLQSE